MTLNTALRPRGFTLVEVLVALSITAFVGAAAYTSLSTVIAGVESARETARRTYEINRAWMIISRDIRHFVPRSVRDEFGQREPALAGGELARFPLSFTRSGWHNSVNHPRSDLQRVNYRVEDNILWRDSYVVLDRGGDTEPREVELLDRVEFLEVAFLSVLDDLEMSDDGTALDTRNWAESWIADPSQPAAEIVPPVALQITVELEDWGELRRLYALPPL